VIQASEIAQLTASPLPARPERQVEKPHWRDTNAYRRWYYSENKYEITKQQRARYAQRLKAER
jgi:hypothetical protein